MLFPKRIIIVYKHQTVQVFSISMCLRKGCHVPCSCIVIYLVLEEAAAVHDLAVAGKTLWGPKISFARYQTKIAAGSCIWLQKC